LHVVTTGRSAGWAYAAMFLVAWATLTLELLCTRIVSAMAFYHLAFFVLSLAILGMTAGALLVYRFPEHFRPESALPRYADWFALSLPFAVGCLFAVPLREANTLTSVMALVLAATVISIPFVLSGILVSLTLTRCGLPYGRIYAADLLGAALGSEAIIPALDYLRPGAIVFVLSILVMVAGYAYRRLYGGARLRPVLMWGVLMGALIYLDQASDHGLVLAFSKGHVLNQDEYQFMGWNSHSFVTVAEPKRDQPLIWGASPRMPKIASATAGLAIDGGAATDMIQFDGDLDKVAWLLYDVTSLPYQLQPPKRAAIIGVGGGRDALTALLAGAEGVVGIDVNSLIIELLHGRHVPALRQFAGLADHPRVRLVHDDARSFLTTSQERFDVVQMSLIDTWAASAAGAYTLTENGLYTMEAWTTFIDRLSDHGLFSVSRWYQASGLDETNRCVAMAVAVCLRLGLTPPRDHIILVASGKIATLVVTKAAITDALRARLCEVCDQRQFQLLLPADPAYAGNPSERIQLLERFAACSTESELQSLCESQILDTRPVSDDRPYFFNQLWLSTIARLYSQGLPEYAGEFGNLKATMMLLIILAVTVAGMAAGIFWPLREVGLPKDLPPAVFRAGVLYFSAIGLGYMLIEMAFVQRFSVLLGHPTYALAWVIGSMVLATGIGSLRSERLPTENPRLFFVYPIVIVVALTLAWLLLPSVFALTVASPLPVRIGATLSLTVPCGLVMGLGFPLGMVQVGRISEAATPWMWGINGAAGVMGTVLAVFLSMIWGISFTMAVGIGCYALLLVANGLLRTASTAPAKHRIDVKLQP
jgi:hypothetical protein